VKWNCQLACAGRKGQRSRAFAPSTSSPKELRRVTGSAPGAHGGSSCAPQQGKVCVSAPHPHLAAGVWRVPLARKESCAGRTDPAL